MEMRRTSHLIKQLARNLGAILGGADLLARNEALEVLRLAHVRTPDGAAELIARSTLRRLGLGDALPPTELQANVGSGTSPVDFWAKGLASADKVVEVFGEHPAAPVLDWGCGTGRTLATSTPTPSPGCATRARRG